MCVSQHRWTGYRGPCSPALPLILLLLLPLSFLSSMPPFAQGAIHIPKDYKVHKMLQPPLLTKMPTSYTAFSLEDIYLPCEASGNPTPTFRWMKDGKLFGSEHNESGTLYAEEEEPLELYEGKYRCFASNTLGTAMTQTIQVIVEAQPVMAKQQKIHLRAFEGESMVLTCRPPQSSDPPLIHWMDKKMVHIKQSERVMVGQDGNLYFSDLLKSDTRDDYTCNAQYTAARTVLPDTPIRLTVMPSNDVSQVRVPRLFRPTGTHTTIMALRENSVTLECIPTGLPTPVVKWKKKDGHMHETSGKLEAHDRWLHFESITQNDDGEYECTASNNVGSVSHAFTLTVEAAPYWVKEPQNLLYSPGETVRLECQAEGIPTPAITWSINGQPVTEVDADPRRSIAEGVLILRDVEFADTAVYQCEATNKHGAILLNTYLYVVELPPQILSSDGVVYRVTEGGDVMLHCESFGSPRPHVTWEGGDKLPLLSDPRVSLLTNGTIELSGASHDDTGEYTCSIKHSNISISAHLEVFNRTQILTEPQHLRTLRGTNALLDCDFYKDPQLLQYRIIWSKDGLELQESSPDDKYTIFENGTLKVTNVHPEDNGVYSCEVKTDLDRVKASGSITVVARPDPPKDLFLSDIEDHSLTLSWIPGHSHNSPIIEFIVEAREEQHSEEGQWKWEEWKKVSGEFNHLELTLHPYCTYRFRVIAINEIGNSDPSKPSEHRSTPPAVPDKNPTGVRSESIDPKTLIITWDEMDKRLHNGQGFQYKVYWRQAGGADVRWNTADVQSPPFMVNNTGTYTPFEIKVQAVNSLGAGPPPRPEIGHSGEDVPEEAPTGVTTTVINSTVRVKWNEAKNVRGLLLGYKIYIRRMGPHGGRLRRSLGKVHHEKEDRSERGKDRDRGSRVVVVHGMKTSEEVTGLQLYSQYELSVAAFNSKGGGPHSPPHHFSTPEGAPGPPASLTFDSPSEKSLILYWTPPVEPNGVLLGYMVQYQEEVESRDSLLQMEIISDPSVTHIILDSLDPSSYYIFKVIARTAAGDGPPITRRGATLLDGVPPSNISIISSNTSLNLSWVPGERDRNHGFIIRYMRKSLGAKWEESEVVNSTQGFYSLKGLQPGSQYHLMIKHENDTMWEDVKWTMGPVPSEMPGGFATQGWLIGLISAIVLLVLILLILCLIKRSKGGKYAVKDKEDKEVDSEARPMKDETFGEYSDADEKRSDSQPSLCGESKLGSDDSLAEYGDSVDIQFNEDGSFIGQYSGRGPVTHGNESSGPASPVNAVPPPPIAPSMSSILNRPS
ncbi:neural cell adhesion molecule L1.1-like isoform X1 [Epinephelus lanceolatus]|uniref:neural cell adhesion molecule L1.1-like isoform X2 n=1 Tax=Epinephelus lanceolatus TaxID=310571 RepID=UPI001445749A|nr:neural cell adhesion molecule L1.1-like isoform X2 [Epinephelus lanceolatus]